MRDIRIYKNGRPWWNYPYTIVKGPWPGSHRASQSTRGVTMTDQQDVPVPAGKAQPRGGNGRFVRTIEGARRDARAAELRARGQTFRQIADELGIGLKEAYEAVQRAMADIVREPAEEVLKLELERLDRMWHAVVEVLERQHVTVSNGKVVTLNGEPIEDDGPVLQAVDRLLKIQERRAKLLGLDAEKKINLSGGVTYEIVGVASEDL